MENSEVTADTIKVYSEGSVFWKGKEYKPDSEGIIELPELAVRHIESHGYAPANVFGKPATHTFERVGPRPRAPLPAIDETYDNDDPPEKPSKAKKAT